MKEEVNQERSPCYGYSSLYAESVVIDIERRRSMMNQDVVKTHRRSASDGGQYKMEKEVLEIATKLLRIE